MVKRWYGIWFWPTLLVQQYQVCVCIRVQEDPAWACKWPSQIHMALSPIDNPHTCTQENIHTCAENTPTPPPTPTRLPLSVSPVALPALLASSPTQRGSHARGSNFLPPKQHHAAGQECVRMVADFGSKFILTVLAPSRSHATQGVLFVRRVCLMYIECVN